MDHYLKEFAKKNQILEKETQIAKRSAEINFELIDRLKN